MITSENHHCQTVRARDLTFWHNFHHPLCVRSHMSHVMCHVLHVFCCCIFFFFNYLKIIWKLFENYLKIGKKRRNIKKETRADTTQTHSPPNPKYFRYCLLSIVHLYCLPSTLYCLSSTAYCLPYYSTQVVDLADTFVLVCSPLNGCQHDNGVTNVGAMIKIYK